MTIRGEHEPVRPETLRGAGYPAAFRIQQNSTRLWRCRGRWRRHPRSTSEEFWRVWKGKTMCSHRFPKRVRSSQSLLRSLSETRSDLGQKTLDNREKMRGIRCICDRPLTDNPKQHRGNKNSFGCIINPCAKSRLIKQAILGGLYPIKLIFHELSPVSCFVTMY